MSNTNKKQEQLSFEETLKKLENIVTALENGNTELEKSLDLFSEGVNLVKNCQNMLHTAEQKVKTLAGSMDGGFLEKDFTDN